MDLMSRTRKFANRTSNISRSALAVGRQDDANDTCECKLLSLKKSSFCLVDQLIGIIGRPINQIVILSR